MAIRTKTSVLGDVSGKLGPVILLKSSGLDLVRSLPKPKKETKSDKLIKERLIFKALMDFFKYFTVKFFRKGYQVRKHDHQSSFNAAISYHRLNAMTQVNGQFGVDITKLKFSSPIQSTQVGWHAELIRLGPDEVQAKWELNPCPLKTTQLNDKAVIIFYHQEHHHFMARDAVRDELSFTLKLSPIMAGDEIFCWLFFTSADGKLVSETQYLGVV